ncbi:MAG: DUF1361 domain-containing protein [Spirochaetaceae bacterium]|nr:DUF1361 domain-containing protein [Spirochaetaceae bacterium]
MRSSRDRASGDLLALAAILGLASLGCALLYGFRVVASGRISYLYLLWNLFLACVPFLIAAVASLLFRRAAPGRRRSVAVAPVVLLWLLFYPNSPYIFTDFIHLVNKVYLRAKPAEWIDLNALVWYDIVMNAAFAFIGHFIGLVSMWLMQALMRAAWGRMAARAGVLAAIFLSGFGIYLGRFSRLNSWDLLFSPIRVLGEATEALSDPKAILFSLVFGLFILLSYGALSAFKRISSPLE